MDSHNKKSWKETQNLFSFSLCNPHSVSFAPSQNRWVCLFIPLFLFLFLYCIYWRRCHLSHCNALTQSWEFMSFLFVFIHNFFATDSSLFLLFVHEGFLRISCNFLGKIMSSASSLVFSGKALTNLERFLVCVTPDVPSFTLQVFLLILLTQFYNSTLFLSLLSRVCDWFWMQTTGYVFFLGRVKSWRVDNDLFFFKFLLLFESMQICWIIVTENFSLRFYFMFKLIIHKRFYVSLRVKVNFIWKYK